MRPDPPVAPKEPSNPPSPVATTATPAVRPKLNLQKRTVSENVQSPPPSASGTDSKGNPFGAARPIDTAAREREVAEKRDRARKEAEEKSRAEKAEKQRQAKEKAKAEKNAAGDANGTKESDPDAPKKSNFEVLRRAGDEGSGDQETEEAKEEPVAAQEQAKEAPDSKTNGSWRRAEPAAAPAGEADEEGWSTVSTNKRNKGRGRGGY